MNYDHIWSTLGGVRITTWTLQTNILEIGYWPHNVPQ